VKGNEICDRLGMDTMAAGNAVALAMDCRARQILARKDTDDIDLTYGNGEAQIIMLDRIGNRKGFGNILAEGVRRAAQMIGKGAEELAVHIKGLEPAGYDPRGMKGVALGFAVGDRGACHMTGSIYSYEIRGNIDRLSYEGKAAVLKDLEDRFAVCDTMIFCRFLRDVTPFSTIVQALPLLTGFELSENQLREAGQRIVNLTRTFNVREGMSRKDDYWPERFYREPLPEGGSMGEVVGREAFDKMLDEYYALRGWDATGKPKKEEDK
jgi:aldehyde:ferredoxin oxidoreductase